MSDQKSGIEAVFATGPCRRADCKSEGSHGFGGFCSAYCRSNPEAAGEKPVHDVAVCQNRMGCSKPPQAGQMFCSHGCALGDDVFARNC